MALPLSDFIRQLIESGLMSSAEVEAFRAKGPAEILVADDALPFARELIRQRRLTAYQAAAIYHGKGEGLVFGNYVVLEKLGQGGMGVVFKARHRRMKRVVALKVMSSAAMVSPDSVRRFHREVEAVAKLSHPHIVSALDADEARGVHFLVMEFVDGIDLAALVQKRGPLPVEQAVDFTLQAARGLEYAHHQGVVHRDIKPANLLVDPNGILKILDMGLARLIDATADGAGAGLTESGAIMGTVDYMSPEQALDTKQADAKSDIYSLGCSLFYLLTGRVVYAGDTMVKKILAHREQPAPSLRGERTGVTEFLDQIFQKLLAKYPDDRYATMAEVIVDLEACIANLVDPSSNNTANSAADWSKLGIDSQMAKQIDPAMHDFLQAIASQSTSPAQNVGTKSERVVGTRGGDQNVAGARNSRLRFLENYRLFGGMLLAATVLTGWLIYQSHRSNRKSGGNTSENGRDSAAKTGSADQPADRRRSKEIARDVVDRDREVAEWVLQQSGEIVVEIDDDHQLVLLAALLPEEPFSLISVSLEGKNYYSTDLDKLAGLSKLETLRLNGNWSRRSPVTDSALKHLASLTTLRKLDLSFSDVSDDGLEQLGDLRELREAIFYACPNVHDDGVAWLKGAVQLEMLHLGLTKVTDEGLKPFENMTHLKNVLLDGTSIHGGGIRYLAKAHELELLHLAGSMLDDAEFEAVAGLKSLQQLSVELTPLTDASVTYLKSMSNLKYLCIARTKISERGAAELRAALPNTDVKY